MHFATIYPIFFLIPILTFSGKSPCRSNITFTRAQLGPILLLVAMSTCKGLLIADAIENIVSFPKKLGGKIGNEIQAIRIVAYSSGLDRESYSRVLIGYFQ